MISNYISEKRSGRFATVMVNSPKRSTEFKRIQEIVDLKPLKILHSSVTRWLSLEAVIKRNLDRFDELKLFFSFQTNLEQNRTA